MLLILCYITFIGIVALKLRGKKIGNDFFIIGAGYLLVIPHTLLLLYFCEANLNVLTLEDLEALPLVLISLHNMHFFSVEFFRLSQKSVSMYNAHCCIIVLMLNVLFFAICFAFLESHHPNSFSHLLGTTPLARSIDFMYFSLLTFTTVGFGDVLPQTTMARAVVSLEIAVAFGVLVIAVNFFRASETKHLIHPEDE